MDVLTHGLLGGAAAQATASREEARLAALVGLAAGMLPDADALLGSSSDPLRVIELHRHFTHALVFVPFGALLATLLLRLVPPVRRGLSFAGTYRFALLGYLPAGLLDACTSYGTHLWWPFSDQRVAWSVIAIVDPLFSLTLAAALVAGVARRRAAPARLGLALAAAYLVAGTIQHGRADALARSLAESRGHAPERLAVKPTIGNLVLWRGTYVVDGVAHADAVRPGLLAASRVYPGDRVPLVDAQGVVAAPPGSRARRDLDRFRALSDGMVARAPSRPELLGDVRYAMLPTSVEPLWGIVLPDDAERPAEFVTNRVLTPAKRRSFVAMLLGRDLPSGDG